jgi:hypothetical protein
VLRFSSAFPLFPLAASSCLSQTCITPLRMLTSPLPCKGSVGAWVVETARKMLHGSGDQRSKLDTGETSVDIGTVETMVGF